MNFTFHAAPATTYGFDEALFSFNGNVIFANFYAARTFAQKINEKRPPDQTVKAGQINALGLIDELQHYALKQYREQKNPRVMQEAFDYLTAQIGPEEVEKTLRRFVRRVSAGGRVSRAKSRSRNTCAARPAARRIIRSNWKRC